jgi:hypothetical protein
MQEKRMLFEDQQRITLAYANIDIFKKKVQRIVDEYLTLELDTPVTREFLYQLINSPREKVRDIYKSRLPSVDLATGLKVNVDQHLNNLVMPDLKLLVELCSDIKVDSTAVGEFMPLLIISDTIELNEDKINSYMDRYRLYSDNAATLKLHAQLSQVAVILNSINASVGFTASTNSILSYDLGQIMMFDSNKQIVLSMDGFKKLTYKL